MPCVGVGPTRDTAGPRALSAQSSELTAQVLYLRVKVVLVSRMTGGVFSMQPLVTAHCPEREASFIK